MNRDPFAAIADPTRREIIDLLAQNPMTINEVAGNFAQMSRQAVTKQIKYLEESRLLETRKKGREKYCYARLDNLIEVNRWLGKYKRFWNKKLDQLGNYLDNKAAGQL